MHQLNKFWGREGEDRSQLGLEGRERERVCRKRELGATGWLGGFFTNTAPRHAGHFGQWAVSGGFLSSDRRIHG